MVKLIIGEEIVPPACPQSTENRLYGDGWIAERKDGRCVLDSLWGGHGGGSIVFEIDETDFERLKADFSLYREIYNAFLG
jgi:hypothetical protein